jgi:hypothetical protein
MNTGSALDTCTGERLNSGSRAWLVILEHYKL